MKKGTSVYWTLASGEVGYGTTVSDEEDGHILVAVKKSCELRGEMHPVIYCATTWLRLGA